MRFGFNEAVALFLIKPFNPTFHSLATSFHCLLVQLSGATSEVVFRRYRCRERSKLNSSRNAVLTSCTIILLKRLIVHGLQLCSKG